MPFTLQQNVKLTDKVLVRKEGKSETKLLNEEAGKVVKIDGEYLYVKTQYGTHYVHQSKVTIV